jgi:pimeloyl-ACP methyl ester carboxylesterase
LLFDKAGVGLSDPLPRIRSVDHRAAEIEAVMDAVGFGRAAVFALSEGGPAAIVFAAKRPERTLAVILIGTFSFMAGGWDDMDRDPAEVRARALPEFGEEYTPSIEQIVRLQRLGRAARSGWGSGEAFKGSTPNSSKDSRHSGQEHRRRPPHHVRRPHTGNPLRRGVAH